MSVSERKRTAIRIHPDDNVVCLLRAHDAGERPAIEGVETPTLTDSIPAGHKVALAAVEPGGLVLKYGYPIGRAKLAIAPGDHVHLHNLAGLSEGSKP